MYIRYCLWLNKHHGLKILYIQVNSVVHIEFKHLLRHLVNFIGKWLSIMVQEFGWGQGSAAVVRFHANDCDSSRYWLWPDTVVWTFWCVCPHSQLHSQTLPPTQTGKGKAWYVSRHEIRILQWARGCPQLMIKWICHCLLTILSRFGVGNWSSNWVCENTINNLPMFN